MTTKKTAWQKVEDHIVKWLVGTFLTAIGAFILFYFDATYTLAQHSEKIQKVSNKIDTIGELPTVNTVKIHNIEGQLNSIKLDSKELKDDFKDFQKKYDADRDRILMILLEIKEDRQ